MWPDLFGRALLARHWGRIGTQGRMRLDSYADAGFAVNALANLARSKRLAGLYPGTGDHRCSLAGATSARAANCSPQTASQSELTECAEQDLGRADAKLNSVYRALMAKIDGANQARLRDAQRAWIAFRDKECVFRTGGGFDQPGTIWPMLVLQCRAELTRTRTYDLQEQLKCPSWDLLLPKRMTLTIEPDFFGAVGNRAST